MNGTPGREVTTGPQQPPRLRVTDRRVNPMPRGRREHEVEADTVARFPRFERALDDVDVREFGKIGPCGRGQRRTDLHARDAKAPARKRDRGLAGGAANLE